MKKLIIIASVVAGFVVFGLKKKNKEYVIAK